jgi:tRNA-splicing ligase RtcB (3'-phosphate/5'-hydroxy nucleic acid ligase)
MNWCQAYAWHNRRYMRDMMVEAVEAVSGAEPELHRCINIHHNYCSCETCRYRAR